MEDNFQNKFRIPSARLQTWDYRWSGAYFITICAAGQKHYFGKVEGDNMILSHAGVIANVLWHEIKHHAKNIELGVYTVMPNHVHGILILTQSEEVTINPVESRGDIVADNTIGSQRFQKQGKNSISSIVGGYKSAVTKHAHRLGFEMEWQERFHDHIIRDEQSFNMITNYIINNAANWQKDKFYSEVGRLL